MLTPLVLLRLALRGLHTPSYWRRWPERFGYVPRLNKPVALWIHAVSVGEVQATLPLVQALRKRIDPADILITTMTPTGSDRVRALYGNQPAHVYVPYDLPGAVARFLDRTQPRLALVMETEIWPNLFHTCHRRGIPVFMVNARMSERSFKGYRRVPGLAAQTLTQVTGILAQGAEDRRRLAELGAPADRLHITGSVKFDIALPPSLAEQAAALRRSWGVERPVWVAASTHQGEDEIILEAFKMLLQSFSNALLILVPRHPERFASAGALCRRKDFSTVLRSEGKDCDATIQVLMGDTMGELTLFFASADVAFVGGSLISAGGHNPLEPAALGVPALFGPHMFNFSDM
ncbi:MAG: lipid IV(A) 3-deoxy-D-manno-octulosonic acid transferase, partial [Gammaproteobacteria bacterium]